MIVVVVVLCLAVAVVVTVIVDIVVVVFFVFVCLSVTRLRRVMTIPTVGSVEWNAAVFPKCHNMSQATFCMT